MLEYICEAEELPAGERTFVEIDGTEIAVFNENGDYYAVRNFCPHMAGPLAKGPLKTDCSGKKTIHCPFHSWGYELETGEGTYPSQNRETVRMFPVKEENGKIYLEV